MPSTPVFDESLSRAVSAVLRHAADAAILPHYRRLGRDEIVAKAADDVVTVADTEAEAILAEGLAAILPEAAIVGEEAAHADDAVMNRLSNRLCWIIDPLDGTNNFAAGKPPFGIMVALAQGGETVAGWIWDPLKQRLCEAQAGKGARIDGAPVHARTSGATPPVAAISLVFADAARRAALTTGIAPHYRVVDIPRCAAEQYARIVLGENDLAVFERTLAWDHAPGALFVNEAGGKVARLDGSAYRPDQVGMRGLIGAASPALFDDLAAKMAALES